MRARRGGRVASVAALVAVASVAACVEIQTAPGGIASLRLDAVPPSIVGGDTLRDSLGRATTLRIRAFGANGDTVTADGARFYAIPFAEDTSALSRVVPVRVDSLTGRVIADPLQAQRRVRLVVRVGATLQLVDTLDVVGAPGQLAVAPQQDTLLPTLSYFCTDDRRTLDTARVPIDGASVLVGLATPAAAVRLARDSAGTTVAVPRYFVEWRVEGPRPIPSGPSPYGNVRPAIHVTAPTIDAPLRFDTTGGDGISRVRVRVIPTLLPRAAWPDTAELVLTARARVAGAAGPVDLPAEPVRFRAVLVRRPLTAQQPCP